jgi:signal transduction histidine kinase/ligand-binding sensor domain-containing protein
MKNPPAWAWNCRRSGFALTWCRTWLGLFLLAGGLTAATPPDWNTRVWEADDGLLDNRVTGLTQSRDGRIWVSTLGGLLRFDGRNFEEFHLSAAGGVIGNGARALQEDSSGNLWLSAYRETLLMVGPTATQVYTTANGIPAGLLNDLVEMKDGTVWLALGHDVLRKDGNQFKALALSNGSTPNGRAALAIDLEGRVWCALSGRIGLLEGQTFQEIYRLADSDVVLVAARRNGVWACAGNRLYRLTAGAPPIQQAELPAGCSPLSLLEDHTGVVWIGTLGHGLFRFDDSGLQAVKISHQQVSALLEDREGNIWAGTYGGGLNRLRPRVIDLQGVEAGLPSTSISSVCQDFAGRYWAATVNGHLVSGDGKTWSVQPTGAMWAGDSAACVAADRSGRLWVGTRGQGLREIDLRTGQSRTWSPRQGPPGGSIRSLFIAADDSLWFSTGGRPGSFYHLAGGALRAISVPSTARNIRSITQDATGQIWVGTSDGQILKVIGDTLGPDPALRDAITTSVRCLHATADGSLWISYAERAIAHFKDGKYTLFTGKTSLVPDIISQLGSDKSGALWLAGSRGLYKLSGPALAWMMTDGRDKPRPNFYGRTEGLPNLQPHYDNFPTVCLAADGQMRFATSLGILSLNPSNIAANPVAPPVFIEAVSVDDRLVALRDRSFPLRERKSPDLAELAVPGTTVQMPPDHYRLLVQFTAPSFSASENVRYRYRLAGLEESWTDAGIEGQARYSRLPSGNYRFEVIACSETGLWSQAPATVALTVPPFIWQEWWFRLGVLAVFTAGVVALVRLVSFRRLQARLRQSEQLAALSQERTRIARDIHDDLGGSLAHIKLLSENAIPDSHSASSTETHLRQITRTTQQVLKSLDETIWAINPSNDTLPHLISYVGQYAVEFLRSAGITCEVDLPDNPPEMQLTPELRHHLFLAVKEALTNVVRHAHARAVRLELAIQNRTLHVTIADDGRGFDPQPAGPHADGLGNMRQRMAAVSGSFSIKSNPGGGTRIELAIGLKPPA